MARYDARLGVPTGTPLDRYLQPEILVAQGRLHPYYDTAGYDPGVLQPDRCVPFDRAEGVYRYIDNLKGPYSEGVLFNLNIDYPNTIGAIWIVHNNTAYKFRMPAKMREATSNITSLGFVFGDKLPLYFGPSDTLKLIVKLAPDEHGVPRHNPDQCVKITYRVSGKTNEDFGGLARGIKQELSSGYSPNYNAPPQL